VSEAGSLGKRLKLAAMAGGQVIQRALRKLLFSSLMQNVFALYWVKGASLLLPLATVPYLARVLGPEQWGLVFFAQAFATWLSLLVDYGFLYSATREIARSSNDDDGIPLVVSGVLGARVFLAAVACVLTVPIMLLVPAFRDHPQYLLLASANVVITAFNPLWFFHGIQKLKFPSVLDVAIRILSTLAIFVFIRSEDDGLLLLVIQVAGSLAVVVALTVGLYRRVSFIRPTLNRTVGALKRGWSMFLFRGAASLYTSANTFLLGVFASPAALAFYVAANKINDPARSLVGPISQAVYPRISSLIESDRGAAVRLMRLTLVAMTFGGMLLALVLIIGAPLWVQLLLGDEFRQAVPILRILAALAPIVALSNALGVLWMLPLGLDRDFNKIIIAGGLMNLALVGVLVPLWSSIGMAVSVVMTELSVAISMWLILEKRKLLPMLKEFA
jgi:PST family polysaccharide transporter